MVPVAAGLRKAYPKLRIEAITGALTPDERRERVESIGETGDDGEAPQRLLVATDCLSEGINWQALFDMVVHYDLSWNPTRHQQREGRVDRFGQRAELVRSVLMFSPDSAIDGAVLDVILEDGFLEHVRKAGLLLRQRLAELQDRFPDLIEEVRGEGLMLGMKTRIAPGDFAAALRAEKLVTIPAGDSVVRLLPPLVIAEEDIREGVRRIEAACAKLSARNKAGQA